jgi:hypothetical protein
VDKSTWISNTVYNDDMSLISIQFYVLLAGTIFAWGNVIKEFYDWTKNKACTTCSGGDKVKNPLMTSCFYGAIFFTIALVLNIML